MARLTVRNLDDSVMQRLRERGAARGVSMEQEARDVIAASLGHPTTEGFDYRGLKFDDQEGKAEATWHKIGRLGHGNPDNSQS